MKIRRTLFLEEVSKESTEENYFSGKQHILSKSLSKYVVVVVVACESLHNFFVTEHIYWLPWETIKNKSWPRFWSHTKNDMNLNFSSIEKEDNIC